MRRALLPILAVFLSAAAPAAASEQVDIEGKLKGVLYKPEGNGPFPAIVALHGCDGLTDKAPIARRYADWGERLAASGFVVLFPDSFAARGIGAQCGISQRSLRSGRDRVTDAEAARRYLQAQPYVVTDHISLIGWANGGVAALWTVRPGGMKRDGKPDFRSAVAFYPGCRRLRDTAWSARLPTLILIGAKDDWAPASLCEQMVAGAKGRSARTRIVVYPGAYHDFDHPDLPLQQLSSVTMSGGPTGRVHVGTDTEARADALKRVPEWIAR
ncbi:MAG TPA: dienelactone hydrolase family protein [Xanthobacteraceae bacterium]|nr:dienelactone hydrolase family protein [Xanthobacteraceae bacterium]